LPKKHGNRKSEALQRVGFTLEESRTLPRITPVLENAERGMPQVIEALRSCPDEDAQVFIKAYDAVSASDMKFVGVEEIAIACGIGIKRLGEIAFSSLLQQSQTAAAIIAATSHPAVVSKTVAVALSDRGTREREMMLIAGGTLPSPKGIVINNRNQQANVNSPGEAAQKAAVPEDISAELPTMDNDIKALHSITSGGKLLNA
jgi:hypothetical protein